MSVLSNILVATITMTSVALHHALPAETEAQRRQRDLKALIARCPEHLFSTDADELRPLV